MLLDDEMKKKEKEKRKQESERKRSVKLAKKSKKNSQDCFNLVTYLSQKTNLYQNTHLVWMIVNQITQRNRVSMTRNLQTQKMRLNNFHLLKLKEADQPGQDTHLHGL